jgi:hypothetical protein
VRRWPPRAMLGSWMNILGGGWGGGEWGCARARGAAASLWHASCPRRGVSAVASRPLVRRQPRLPARSALAAS